MEHAERRHSKFSASGAERWTNCPGSVPLSEGIPSKDSKYSIEGTHAHEILEKIVRQEISGDFKALVATIEMVKFAKHSARHILEVYENTVAAELMIETRVLLDFIHPEAFGSLDYAVVEPFGTLHILDFKYGKYMVSPKENLQFLFYALAVAHLHHWNFKRVRMWALQPRVRNFQGYTFWEITIDELKKYVKVFHDAIKRVEENPFEYKEGKWCHFCPAKGICPLKTEAKIEEARLVFSVIDSL